jgi:hypothetical protein
MLAAAEVDPPHPRTRSQVLDRRFDLREGLWRRWVRKLGQGLGLERSLLRRRRTVRTVSSGVLLAPYSYIDTV